MRSEKSKRIILTVTILSLAMISTTILYAGIVAFAPLETKDRSSSGNEMDVEPIKPEGTIESPPIHIDDTGSNNWEWALAAGICTDLGSPGQHSYVISHLIIDAGNSGNGILIENSNEYFKIKDCTVINSGTGGEYAGIKLINTTNGLISQSDCYTNEYGISLVSSDNNNIVYLNDLYNNKVGISLVSSNYNTIWGNIARYNEVDGISLVSSNYNIISENNANDNDVDGISLVSSNYNTISDNNNANENDVYGISLISSNYNTISGNTANENNFGIVLDNSHGNTVSGNTANGNSIGIYLRGSNNNDLLVNTVSGNEFHGILLSSWSSYNTILGNTAAYNWMIGIYLTYSNNNELGINTVYGNRIGIVVQYSNDNTLRRNAVGYNSQFQTRLIGGTNNNILGFSNPIHIDNSAANNWEWAKTAGICTGFGTESEPYVIQNLIIIVRSLENGILIENSNVYFRIENCLIYNAKSAIKLDETTNGKILNNKCFLNDDNGIYLGVSDHNTISGNTASNNYIGIYIYGDYNNVSGNTANNNYEGIFIYGDYNNVSGNIANYNNGEGIHIYGSHNNVSGNNANNNNGYGIYLDVSNNNTISGNTISINFHGIFLRGSNNNIISENIVKCNYEFGISLHVWSSGNTGTENVLIHNSYYEEDGCGGNNIGMLFP